MTLMTAFWQVFPSISIFPVKPNTLTVKSKVCLFSVFSRVFPLNFNFSHRNQKFVYFQSFDEFFPSISTFYPSRSKVCLFSVFWRVYPFNFNFPQFLKFECCFVYLALPVLVLAFGLCWTLKSISALLSGPSEICPVFEIIALILSINQSKPRNESRDISELRQVCVCEKQSLISPQNSGQWLGKKLILLATDFVFLFLLLTKPASQKTAETSFSSLLFCVAQEEWCYSRRLDGK